MAQLIQQRRYPAEVMVRVAEEDKKRGPYQPCPCGSGLKFPFCHGRTLPPRANAGQRLHSDIHGGDRVEETV
jgi:uncharacterized protein